MSSHPLDTLSVLSSRPARRTHLFSLFPMRLAGTLQSCCVLVRPTFGAALIKLGRCASEQGVHGEGKVQLFDIQRVEAGLQR